MTTFHLADAVTPSKPDSTRRVVQHGQSLSGQSIVPFLHVLDKDFARVGAPAVGLMNHPGGTDERVEAEDPACAQTDPDVVVKRGKHRAGHRESTKVGLGRRSGSGA
jgi:hypothetical protein